MWAFALVPACSAEAGGTGTAGSDTPPPCNLNEPGCTREPCTSIADCRGVKDWLCSSASCVGGVCAFTYSPKGQPYPPPEGQGDCQKRQCDGAGGTEDVPLRAQTACRTNNGRTCDGAGHCRYCASPSAACEDTEPGGASNNTQGAAYNFGSLGVCDGSGSQVCGATKGSDVDWSTYTTTGEGGAGFLGLCANDPRMQIYATASIHACVYASCNVGPVTCGEGKTPSTAPGGQAGCCQDGLNIDISTCSASEVWFSIQPSSGVAACIGYDFRFHP